MKTFETIIRERREETRDTVTLVLEPVEQHIEGYRAGQFLTVDPYLVPALQGLARDLERSKGRREKPRAYSLASAPHEPLAITVKEEPPGEWPSLLSPWLVRDAGPGDRLPVSGFTGVYVAPAELPANAHLVHLCAGSGIVPNYAIIKDLLHRGSPVRQTLLYSNKAWPDVIFRDGLSDIAERSEGRLELAHALTRDPRAPDGVRVLPRRIDEQMLREHVPDFETAWFYVCGPAVPPHERAAAKANKQEVAPRFLETQRALLASLGIPRSRVFTEGW